MTRSTAVADFLAMANEQGLIGYVGTPDATVDFCIARGWIVYHSFGCREPGRPTQPITLYRLTEAGRRFARIETDLGLCTLRSPGTLKAGPFA